MPDYWTSSSSGDRYPEQPRQQRQDIPHRQPYYAPQYSAPVERHYIGKKESGGIFLPLVCLAVAAVIGLATNGGQPTSEAVEPVLKTDQPVATKKKKAAAAPAIVEIPPEDAEDYIGRYAPIAVAEMHKYHIPASITLAQGLVESQAGSSRLALVAMNHFGIKCFSKGCQQGHCLNFTDDTHKDFFRVYSSAWASYRAHSEFLSNGRYAELKQHGNDYREWANGLKRLGYATAPNYASALIQTIEKYNLDQYDNN